ncbi:hypothetical protein C8F04DRAFT_513633 [Mycena alexandri]|uniref:Uncharacterized protein n=1 Tax=Mycena alexandri TaxID=1745969 RepID=A0AAD6X4W4_9AGAR|nr:hypothetical protein C8F04DRAFT_513633 [Mycena alexandri]
MSSLTFSLTSGAVRPLVVLVGAGIEVAFLLASKSPNIPSSSVVSPTRMRDVEPSKTLFNPGNAAFSSTFIATGAIAVTTLFLGVLYWKGLLGRGNNDDDDHDADHNDSGGSGGEVPSRGDPPGADPTDHHHNEPGPNLDGEHPGEEPPPPPPPGPGIDSFIPNRWILLIILLLILVAIYFRQKISQIRQYIQVVIALYKRKRAMEKHWIAGPLLRTVWRMRSHWLGSLVLNQSLHLSHAGIVMLVIYAQYDSMWFFARWILLSMPRMAARFSIRHLLLGSSVASVVAALLGFAIHRDCLTLAELWGWLQLSVLHYIHGCRLLFATLAIDLHFSVFQQKVLFALPAVVFVYRVYRNWVTPPVTVSI